MKSYAKSFQVQMTGIEDKCMYRLRFARSQLHVLRKSLICIRPFNRLCYLPWPCWKYARASVSLLPRPFMTKWALRLWVRFYSVPCIRGLQTSFATVIWLDCNRNLIFLPIKVSIPVQNTPRDPCQLVSQRNAKFVVLHPCRGFLQARRQN